MEPARLSATDVACRRGERLLFHGLSFELNAGQALQVVGPNGTGKSSLLRILAGLLRPEAGTVGRTGDVALLDERLALDDDLPLARALAFWERIDRGGYPDLGHSNPPPPGEGDHPEGGGGALSVGAADATCAPPPCFAWSPIRGGFSVKPLPSP